VLASPSIGADANVHVHASRRVKRALIAGLGIAMVSKLTIKDDVRRKLLAIVSMKAGASVVAPSWSSTIRKSITAPHATRCCKPSTRIEVRTVFPTKKLRDEAVEKYHAIEGGQQT
jgi:hypothetical protein